MAAAAERPKTMPSSAPRSGPAARPTPPPATARGSKRPGGAGAKRSLQETSQAAAAASRQASGHRRGRNLSIASHPGGTESQNEVWKGSLASLLQERMDSVAKSDELLDQVLQSEKLMMQYMRQEYMDQQRKEYDETRSKLNTLRSLLDKLHIEGGLRNRKLHAMEEEAERLRKAVGSGDSAFVRARQVIAEIEESDQQAAKALSQKAVLVHMCQRYKAEIEELNQQVDASQRQKLKLQDDIKAQAATLRQLRKDIKVEEKLLKKVNENLARRSQFVQAGSRDLEQINQFHTYQVAKQEKQRQHRSKVLARALGQIELDEMNAIKSTCIARQLYNNMLDGRLTAEEEKLSALESSFQQLRSVSGCNDIDGIVKKFRSRAETNQQLKWMVEEVRATADTLRKSNQELMGKVKRVTAEERQPVKTREVYHEVDKIDSDLKHALNEFEESKAKAQRTYIIMEELRLAISKYLSKIENKPVVVPAKEQLPESVHKLTTKLTEMIAAVSQHIGDVIEPIRDEGAGNATTAAGAAGTGSTGGSSKAGGGGGSAGGKGGMSGQEEKDSATRPYAVLNTSQVTDLLYKKLMATEVDTTARNLRVVPKETSEELAKKMKTESYVTFMDGPGADASERDDETADEDHDEDPLQTVVDRSTVKKISGMIVSKNRKDPKQEPPKPAFRPNVQYKPLFKEFKC